MKRNSESGTTGRIHEIFGVSVPVVGMVHLPPLPGSPGVPAGHGLAKVMAEIEEFVVRDVTALVEGGVDGIMVENFGDSPFFPGRNPPHVLTCMTRLTQLVGRVSSLPVGVNILRNDGISALAVAVASGARFIRVNVLSGARVTDQGVIQGEAHELLRYRRALAADHVAIMADVRVKHSAPLGVGVPLEQEVADLCLRGMADAVIVSGSGTGRAVDVARLQEIADAAGNSRPVFIGSGSSSDNVKTLARLAGGFIVGTAFKVGGDVHSPVDPSRVREFTDAVSQVRD